MPNNSTVKAQRQSLRNIHYAILTSDTTEGAVYETPQPLVGAISASISPTTNQVMEQITEALTAALPEDTEAAGNAVTPDPQ